VVEESNLPDFEQTVLPHLNAAYNLARWLTRNQQNAQDAVQEACLRAFLFFPTFRGGDARAWLMKIVRNVCYSLLHANRSLQDALEFDENVFAPDPHVCNPEETVIGNDRSALLRKALEKLSPHFREVLVLREIEEMSYKEIADITGMPPGTVMSSLSRARHRLRQVLISAVNEKKFHPLRHLAAGNWRHERETASKTPQPDARQLARE
jgi:RNA polymerase sigma-70 factor, ECF subfamily